MRLIEQTVQKVALDFLVKRYRFRARGKLFSGMELRTKKEFGGKRADGLIAFRHWIWGVYTISMEAKSYKTLPAVKPYFDRRQFFKNCSIAGFLFSIFTGAFSYLFILDDQFVQFLLPLVMFLIGAMSYGLLTYQSFRNYKMKVIEQIHQYPANEQWLAFSLDSLNTIPLHKIEKLKAICSQQGVGLLLVQSRKQVEVVVEPRQRWHFWEDFLKFYAKGEEVRKKVGGA